MPDRPAAVRSVRPRWPVLLVLGLILAGLGAPRPAWAEVFGDLSIEVEPAYSESISHGYTDYRLILVNRSAASGHEVLLEFSSDSPGGRAADIEAIRRTVYVGPGAEVNVSLFQPYLSFDGDAIKVWIDGQLQPRPLLVRSALTYLRPTTSPLLFMDRSLDLDVFEERLGIKRKSAYHRDLSITEASTQMGKWPTVWLGYSRYDGVIVAAREFGQAPPEVKGALVRYVEAGGTLLMIGDGEVPPPWQAMVSQEDALRIHVVGFGRWMVFPGDDPRYLTEPQWKAIRRIWEEGAYWWGTKVPGEQEANRRLPVTEGTGVPIRAMFLLIFVFTLAIGPVNLWVLSRLKRKIWIFWTIPLFSVLTCAVIFGYAALAEGWSITARSVSFTILDETTHRATTIGWAGFYSPLTYSEGFRFPTEAEVSLCVSAYRYNRPTRGRQIDWGHEQRFGQGWLAARVPTHFLVRRCETRRERLTLNRLGDGGLAVVNGLGQRIKRLWLCDGAGRLYQGVDLEPGQERRLSLDPVGRAASSLGELRSIYVNDWLDRIREAVREPERLLVPGSYLAELEAAPFFECPLAHPAQLTEESVVLGLLKSDGG